MALINRVSRLFKADFHAVLDQIEEPELLLKQAIRDMEDDLTAAEQRVILCAHDLETIETRRGELEASIADNAEQLDICFDSGKNDLAKNLVRRKLESERLLKRLVAKHTADEKYLLEQRAALDENRATLNGLQQKAELFAQRVPNRSKGHSEFGDIEWLERDMLVGDDEVEVAFLREKNRRSGS